MPKLWRQHQLTQTSEPSSWQQLSPAELDLEVKLMIRLRLIERRRIWVTRETKTMVGTFYRLELPGPWVLPDYEYRVTWLGEKLLAFREWLRRVRA